MLILDLETHRPEGAKGDPDFREDIVDRWGWLKDGENTAQWSSCVCPFPGEIQDIGGHYLMYDMGFFPRFIEYAPLRYWNVHDTMALAYANGERDLSLKGLGSNLLGLNVVPWEQQHLIGEDQYHAQDLFLTRWLFPKLMERNRGTAYDIDRQAIPALISMSYRGLEIDQDRLEQEIENAEQMCDRTERMFKRLTEGQEILLSRRKKVTKKRGVEYVEKRGAPSIGAPLQIQKLLGIKTSNDAMLTDIAAAGGDRGIMASLIQQWREADKLLDTYLYKARGKKFLTGLYNITVKETGEGGAGSGRTSSERENMQNQPDPMERCLRAPDGFLLRRGDYPQLELRCGAEMSSDEYLIRAFNEGRDLHEETRVRLSKYLPTITRTRAKNFNFGAGMYGGSDGYIAHFLGAPIHVVRELMAEQRRDWHGWWSFVDRHWANVQATSYSVLPEPFLQRRYISLMMGDHSYKAAINHPPQGMASYICKAAVVEGFQAGWMLCNTVHDAIYDWVPEDEDPVKLQREMADVMTETARKYLPRIGADVRPEDIKISKYWREPDEVG